MRRKLFFFLERLQIPRRERRALASLSVMVVIYMAVSLTFEQRAHYDATSYEELERVFAEKSRVVQVREERMMNRYNGAGEPILQDQYSDPLNVDTLCVDPNRADLADLQTLPGIGPVYAQRIMDWREVHGPFRSAEELLEVQGIGPVRLEQIRPYLSIQNGNSR